MAGHVESSKPVPCTLWPTRRAAFRPQEGVDSSVQKWLLCMILRQICLRPANRSNQYTDVKVGTYGGDRSPVKRGTPFRDPPAS
jgi:hypothetical protein